MSTIYDFVAEQRDSHADRLKELGVKQESIWYWTKPAEWGEYKVSLNFATSQKELKQYFALRLHRRRAWGDVKMHLPCGSADQSR